ncbi:WD40-repeat-containing domain protein [Flagelloscypha sp. PMI_526]|nr:WD40-repeat-containing domain protein [Flagelloscypha sp. PMI_526]
MSAKSPQEQIKSYHEEFDGLLDAFTSQYKADDEPEDPIKEAAVIRPLADICAVVQKAVTENHEDLTAIVAQAEEAVQAALESLSSESESFDFIESFSHPDEQSLIKDPEQKQFEGGNIIESFFKYFGGATGLESVFGQGAGARAQQYMTSQRAESQKFADTARPHALTSRISRFRTWTLMVDNSTPTAQAVLQARFSADRDPALYLYNLASAPGYGDLPREESVKVGLSHIAYDGVLDISRKLVYVADDDRIKSYGYGQENSTIPVHTLRSSGKGPLHLLDGGSKLIRAAKGIIDVWDIDSLPTHGTNGNKRIGKMIDIEDSWRDNENEDIERSSGSSPTSTLQLTNETNIHSDGKMLAVPTDSFGVDYSQRVWSIDLNAGGLINSRYLGHSGLITGLTTSSEDPNSFFTTSRDGFARLYDVRQPLPVLTIDHGNEPITSNGLYIHVEGIPILFTGCNANQAIKVWDPRARTMLYEIATGNNSVSSMAWDAPRSTLFAATGCDYMDRMGNYHDYRYAKVPGAYKEPPEEEDHNDEDEDEDDEDEYEDDYDEDRCWPKNAVHKETHWGYAFDSGDHRLFKYKFGVDSDPKILPAWGDATVGGSMW